MAATANSESASLKVGSWLKGGFGWFAGFVESCAMKQEDS